LQQFYLLSSLAWSPINWGISRWPTFQFHSPRFVFFKLVLVILII
jgi:hypothetical protein